jgi:hypothetical protein
MRLCINDLFVLAGRRPCDRVCGRPQTLILPLTRSIVLWARVSGVSARENMGDLHRMEVACRSTTLDPALAKG